MTLEPKFPRVKNSLQLDPLWNNKLLTPLSSTASPPTSPNLSQRLIAESRPFISLAEKQMALMVSIRPVDAVLPVMPRHYSQPNPEANTTPYQPGLAYFRWPQLGNMTSAFNSETHLCAFPTHICTTVCLLEFHCLLQCLIMHGADLGIDSGVSLHWLCPERIWNAVYLFHHLLVITCPHTSRCNIGKIAIIFNDWIASRATASHCCMCTHLLSVFNFPLFLQNIHDASWCFH